MAAYTPVRSDPLCAERNRVWRLCKGTSGRQRFANLTMLVEKASWTMRKIKLQGLFNFVRYIEQLQAYQVDYGEVNLTGAGNYRSGDHDDPQE